MSEVETARQVALEHASFDCSMNGSLDWPWTGLRQQHWKQLDVEKVFVADAR